MGAVAKCSVFFLRNGFRWYVIVVVIEKNIRMLVFSRKWRKENKPLGCATSTSSFRIQWRLIDVSPRLGVFIFSCRQGLNS